VRYIGLSDRRSFYDYGSRPAFSHVIKKAHNKIEEYYEEKLLSGVTVGAIFALKNLGWADKQEHLLSSDPEKPMSWTINVKKP
jgi:hypothetical protein